MADDLALDIDAVVDSLVQTIAQQQRRIAILEGHIAAILSEREDTPETDRID